MKEQIRESEKQQTLLVNHLLVLLNQAKLVDGTKNTIWKNGHYIQPLENPIAPVSLKKKEDPKVLKKLSSDAAEAAFKKILEQL